MAETTSALQQSEAQNERWRFRDRWRIEGCLYTVSPLHIGSGEIITRPDLVHDGVNVKINAHTVDHTGWACIFGSTLKGSMRSWLDPLAPANSTLRALIEVIMGIGSEDDVDNDISRGGVAEFHNARLSVTRTEPTPLPYWNDVRQTWIETSNSINRHTRTAADEHLVHTECVPAGVGFDLVITGFFENDRQVACLLAALEGFNDPVRPVLIGADTASGKGRMQWAAGKIYKMGRGAVQEWVKNSNRRMAESDMKLLGHDQKSAIFAMAASEFAFSPLLNKVWHIPITLKFDSHFLVNDPPSQQEINNAADPKDVPNHRPRLDEMGSALLPAKSFRGAFRSQAERILRTLKMEYACDPSEPKETSSCQKSIASLADKGRLCLGCQIFGATGWKSPVEISDFRLEPGMYQSENQEFVAVDRFTGGGKDGAKFNALSIYRPVFIGHLRIDESRLPKEGLAALALALRDLQEGDITFGFGAAKGYGSCTADIPIMEDNGFKEKVRESFAHFRKLAKEGE